MCPARLCLACTTQLHGQHPSIINYVCKTGEETFFKIKKGTKMSKVFTAFAKRKGVQASSLRFLMDGDRVKEDDTPLSLDLEDQDMLDCMLEQTGGC